MKITTEDIQVGFHARQILKGISIESKDKELVGIIGPNGSGKSTLLKCIYRILKPDAGAVYLDGEELHSMSVKSSARKMAVVAQHNYYNFDFTVREVVLMGRAPHKKTLERDNAKDYQIVDEALKTVQMETFADRTFSTLSGGEQQRVILARALAQQTPALILDEPTNHLDIDSLIWLENWLRRVEATVVIISHDREFLDRAVTTIWSVEDDTVCRYAGNYSAFESQRIEKLRLQDAAAKAYEREASHLSSFIERFRAKATKARQAQSRIKMLEKLKAVEPVRAKREWRFEFPKPVRLPEHLVDTENLRLGYDERVVIDRVTLSIRSGERIGILGVNGAGKSTLVKGIVGDLAPMAGELRRGQGLEIGYFAQHQLDQLRPDESPLEHMRRMAPDVREQDLRDYLGIYRFSGDFASAPVGPMSGGEKARLALALLAWRKPNLLVLDEPTNHLDMETREALTMALSTYEGAVLIVSHDRHLLRATTERLILVHDGAVQPYDGDLDDYAQLVLEHRRTTVAAEKAANQAERLESGEREPSQNRKEARRAEAQERQRIAALRKPLQKELAKVEKELAQKNEELRKLSDRLADGDFYTSTDPDEVARVLREHGELKPVVEELEMRWLELSEEIEAVC